METIKVNMNPNPLDVQTIHASQNDTEARQWEFELHNNGELIDTSEITEQMVFKSYKGGTEQILPENGVVPVTAPFVGDIKYPDTTRTDQEFTYRQSPTEEDGLAKIKNLYGNTLNWNQLIKNGNFETATDWINSGSSYTVSNGVATVKSTNASNQFGIYQRFQKKAQHTYFISFEMHSFGTIRVRRNRFSSGQETVTEGIYQRIETAQADATLGSAYQICFAEPVSDIDADYFTLKNYMIVDLTAMGLDITDPSDFTSLFPLSYYSYNQGSLLSFMGEQIKTVGFNQWDEEWETGRFDTTTGASVSSANQIRSKNPIRILPNTNYYFDLASAWFMFLDVDLQPISGYSIPNAYTSGNSFALRADSNYVFTTPSNAMYMKFYTPTTYGGTYNNDICINISSSRNGEYEPYTSSTLSLPISTYFPTGMKSAGNVYDELTPTKAITRVGAVDLGTLNWTYSSTTGHLYFNSNDINTLVKKASAPSTYANIVCQKYNVINENEAYSNRKVGIGITTNGSVRVYDPTYTNVADFKTAMSGVYLYYELATSTETSFTTASLVTENAEIPLSNNDGTLIGKCTEQLSENPGFIDAKIKLSDSDGTCYSNKLQLHVERKPS